MALLQKLKEKLGIGGTTTTDRTETEVTVEHDPAESTDQRDGGDAAGEPAAETEQGAAAETDAAASSETLVDEDAADDPEDAAEPAEAAGPDAQDLDTADDDEDAQTADSSQADADGDTASTVNAETSDVTGDEATDATDSDPGTPVETIKGIGPAYADRLAEIGITSVADLAAADPADVGEGANVGESRAATWIERANAADA